MLQALDDFDRVDDGYGAFSDDDPQEVEDPSAEGFSNLVDDANAILLEDPGCAVTGAGRCC